MVCGGRDSEPARARSPWHHGRTGSGQPLGADRRCQVLRPGAPASLAGGCLLPRLRQRYRCRACARRFDDLTGTVLAGHHQPLRVWVLCLYLMGLNLSTRQITQELSLDRSDVQAMTEQLRGGLVAKAPPVRLAGEVEIDEVYVVAGHKGQPAAVAKGGGLDAAADWRERQAAAHWRRRSHPSSA